DSRREVGSQAQTEASLKRRSVAQSRATYLCNYCQKTFTRRKSLQDHFLRHENRRGYACTVHGCLSRFNTQNDYRRHVRIVHAQHRDQRYVRARTTSKLLL
ncbi:hypothetical protein FB107DRAFT_190732, partial [Schizophyllum commune]